MFRRTRRLAFLMLGAVLLGSCISKNLGDFCSFSTSPSLSDADSNSLGIILGAPPDFMIDSPTIVISSPSMADQEVSVRLELIAAPIPWPEELDETPCRGLDWRTYQVSTDPAQWKALWDLPRPAQFEFQLMFPGMDAPKRLPAASLGIAVVDTTSGKVKSCGCYWT